MFNTGSGLTPSDVLALSNNDENGMFGGNAWWVLIIFILIFGWGNNGNGFWGNGSSGASENYVLASDFATLQRMISDGNNTIGTKLNSIGDGICSLGYDQLGQMNGINTNIMASTNAIQSQLSECCCNNREAIAGVNYNMATNTNTLATAISNGFCQTNFNAQTNTRDIVDSNNAGTQAILTKLSQMEASAKDDKIAELTAMNSDLRLAASQQAQNNYLVGQLRPAPIPAYYVQNPYCSCGQTYAGYFGQTIA